MGKLTNSLQRVAAGDPGAIRTCIDTYGDMVWTLIKGYGITDAVAEKAVESVFAELWHTACLCPDGASGERAFIASCVRRRLPGIPSRENPMGPAATTSAATTFGRRG